MSHQRVKATGGLSRRKFSTAAAVALSMPAILRHSRAFAQEPVFKVGYASGVTGPFSASAEPDPFVLGEMRTLLSDGVENNGRRVKIEIIDRDTESYFAAEAASDLIYKEQVDLIAATSKPDTVVPVADLAELDGVPCITTDCPWQPFFFGRSGDPAFGFEWTFHFNWGVEDLMTAFVALWNGTGLEKTVGGLFADTPNAKSWTDPETGFPSKLKELGLTWVQPPFYANTLGARGQPAPDDFLRDQIKMLNEANCQIMTGNMAPGEFALFWDQATALDYRPEIATIARGLIYRPDIESLGDRPDRITTEVWWSPSFPYRSSLTGQSAQELADAYTAATGRAWTMPLGEKYALFEVIADVIKRTADIDDKAAIIDAVASTDLQTIAGPISWTGTPVKNVAKTPLVTGQWQREGDGFRLVVVDNTTHPEIPTNGELQLMG